MAGIFSGIRDSITGKGGAPGSPLQKPSVNMLTGTMHNSLNDVTRVAQQAEDWVNLGYNTQQNLLPYIYQQLGVGMDRQADGSYGNFRYEGTDAQRSIEEMARLGQSSLGAQYANAGYEYIQNPDGSYSTPERADSQRYQFLDAQGRSVADAERLRTQAMYSLLDPNGASQQAMGTVQGQIGQSSALRDAMLQRLYQDMGRGDSLYNEALGSLQGNQGVQGEALDATSRQLATAEGLQNPALDRLGISRDAAGNYINDPNSRQGQYDQALLQQMRTGQGLQGATLAQMGYARDASGNLSFNPSSAPGQLSQAYQQLLGQAQGEVGTSQQLRDAGLGRTGMMRDANGQWVNDPNSNEMRARGLQGDFLSRAQAAMQGNAPVDPGVERSLAEEKRLLNETMIRQLGPGWMTTSPGQEAMRNYEQRANETRYRVQQDALGLGVNQARGLQDTNLLTLQSLYGSGDATQRALTGAGNIANSATNASNQTNLTNAQVMAQLQAGVLNPITSAGNLNAQNLAALYGLTGAAQSAAGQLGTLGNQNIATNAGAYGNLNSMGAQNQQNTQAGFANVGNQGVHTANMASLLNSMNLGNINAYGNTANIGQDAINSRATGALNFQNSNAAILAGIPQQQQQLSNTANNARLSGLAALFPATSSAFDASGKTDLARLYGNLGGIAGNLLTGIGGQIMQGDQEHYNTNINNLFWQNLMASGGQYVGSGFGGAASPMGGKK